MFKLCIGKDFSPFKVKEKLNIAKKKKKEKKGEQFSKGKRVFLKTIFMPLCLLDVKSNDADDKFFMGA